MTSALLTGCPRRRWSSPPREVPCAGHGAAERPGRRVGCALVFKPEAGAAVKRPGRAASAGGSEAAGGGALAQQLLPGGVAQALEEGLFAERVAPALDLPPPGGLDRQAPAGVPGGLPGAVLGEAPVQVLGGTRVERAVAATQQVDVGHG